MTQAAGEAGVLTYAGDGRAPLSARGWKALFCVGVTHLAVIVSLLVATSKGMLVLIGIVRDAPRDDWFLRLMAGQVAGLYAMVAVNSLAVVGYWAAWRRRPPRPWFLAYVPTQLALMGLILGATIVLAAASPHPLTPGGSIGTSYFALVVMVPMFAVLNLPLFLLLVPRIRRGCLGR